MSQFQREFTTTAIEHYGLELDTERVDTVVMTWFQTYDPAWVVKALVESLYRGRYKVKSVDNILKDWQRRGSPFHKFTPDYEREILQSLPLTNDPPTTVLPSVIFSPVSKPKRALPIKYLSTPDREQLDLEESAPFQHHDRLSLLPQPTSVGEASASAAAYRSEHRVNLDANSAESISKYPSSDEQLNRSISSAQAVLATSDRGEPSEIGVGEASALAETSSLANRNIAPPVKLHLFNKLREIVEPTDPHTEGIQHSV